MFRSRKFSRPKHLVEEKSVAFTRDFTASDNVRGSELGIIYPVQEIRLKKRKFEATFNIECLNNSKIPSYLKDIIEPNVPQSALRSADSLLPEVSPFLYDDRRPKSLLHIRFQRPSQYSEPTKMSEANSLAKPESTKNRSHFNRNGQFAMNGQFITNDMHVSNGTPHPNEAPNLNSNPRRSGASTLSDSPNDTPTPNGTSTPDKPTTPFSQCTKNGECTSRPALTYDAVWEHNKKDDQWLVVNGKAYDVTEFAKRHPGGTKIISNCAGEDATDAWEAFHIDKEKVTKYMKALYVGDVVDPPLTNVAKDFQNLRKLVENNGWLKPVPWFLALQVAQIIMLELAAAWVLRTFGTGWTPLLVSLLLLTTSQNQAGYTQHDCGHLSVYPSLKVSHLIHQFCMGFIKGYSATWWNERHSRHHAKPNVIKKDPDLDVTYFFVVGDTIPVIVGKKKKGFMPFQWQHLYFSFVLPPVLLPIYFHWESFYFQVKGRLLLECFLIFAFVVRFYFLFGALFHFWGALGLYFAMRVLESTWFTWVSQMSHLPNKTDWDRRELTWFELQLRASCNVHSNLFNDWFTGHLNYQIEHHLFPTMPRCNFYKVAPLVQSLCKKHGIEYRNKTFQTALADIIRMLKKSGQLWYDTYYNKPPASLN